LIEKGADLSKAREPGRWTLLHYAVDGGLPGVVEFLVNKGCNLEARDLTPLHVAAVHGRVEAARVVLAYGANFTAFCKAHKAPLDWATERGHQDVIRLLTPTRDNR
jgi:ankyrin repeat protein